MNTCNKCNRQFTSESELETHRMELCYKLPTDFTLYLEMTMDMMSHVLEVEKSALTEHLQILGIVQKHDIDCLHCGLRVSKYAVNNHNHCTAIYKHFGRLSPIVTRHFLIELVREHSLLESSKIIGNINDESLRKHLKRLAISTKNSGERKAGMREKAYRERVSSHSEETRKRFELFLTYYKIDLLGEYLNASKYTAKRMAIDMGITHFPTLSKRQQNTKAYVELHGAKPDAKVIFNEGVLVPELTALICKRCDLLIYDNASDMPMLELEKTTKRRPVKINQWTQQAIAFTHDANPDWKIYDGKWTFHDKKDNTFYREGERLCRFCVADLLRLPPPTPPEWVMISGDAVEATTDGDGYFDDFDELEVMYG